MAIRELEVDRTDHNDPRAYRRWIAEFERDAVPDVLPHPEELVSVVLVVPDGAVEVSATIRSLVAQTYPYWELHMVTSAVDQPAPFDERVTVHASTAGDSAAAMANVALGAMAGRWVTPVTPGDTLAPNALADSIRAAHAHPSAQLIYSDEDVIDAFGQRRDPWFKPDYSRELLRTTNYVGHLVLYSVELVRRLGGWSEDVPGSEDFDLNLRAVETIDPSQVVHVPHVLYHARASSNGTIGPEESASRALRAHLRRLGSYAEVIPSAGSTMRIDHVLPTPPPHVSIIVPTRDNAEILRACIESVLSRTTYSSFDILVVDNGSSSPAALRLLDHLDRDDRVRVLRHPGPFNFAAINNAAVGHATGDVVVLMNDDIEVITEDWLGEMVGWAAHDGIGCVGAKLLYPNGRIQHAGVVLGIRDYAGHAHKYFPRDHPGDNGRLQVARDVSAVTGACLVVRKDIYLEVGGMDIDLAVSGNDIDFCLRVREAGYSNVWTPFAELHHHESATRGRDLTPARFSRRRREAAHLRDRWDLSNDPFYSPNLTRDRDDFSPRSQGDTFG